MTAAYGARTIKRERRTRARVEQLDQQIIEELRSSHPQSVRHVFYRMTNPRLPEPVEKSDRGYRHVQQRCLALRRCDAVSYSWITDTSRSGYFVDTYGSAADFLRQVKGLYRADLWSNCPTVAEVWTESRSIAGVLRDLCEELAVPLYPCAGFSSVSFAYLAVQQMNHYAKGRTVRVLYIGDHDKSGVLIDKALEREQRAHLAPDVRIDFQRLAITEEQIALYDLPSKPSKASDRRAPHIRRTVEAEAMPATVLRELVRARIEELLPHQALLAARVAEESERDMVERLAGFAQEVRP